MSRNIRVASFVLAALVAPAAWAQGTYTVNGVSGFMQDLDPDDGFDYLTQTAGTWRARVSIPAVSGFTLVSNSQNQGGSLTRYSGSVLEELVLVLNGTERVITSTPVNGQITLWDRASFRGGTDSYEFNFTLGQTRITLSFAASRGDGDTGWNQLFVRGTPGPNTPDNDFIPLFPNLTERAPIYLTAGLAIDGFAPQMPGRGRYNGDTQALTALGNCPSDFNNDGQSDFFDYLDFAAAYSNDDPLADFNRDGQVDFFDYLDFAAAFSVGCD
ncbi:MAG: hypothetical protein SFZ23_00940 [Planctomycetota bacterium]|nr:hypothetical protein [Planctomycetota bacterium]